MKKSLLTILALVTIFSFGLINNTTSAQEKICVEISFNLKTGSSDKQTEGQVTLLQKFLNQESLSVPVTGYFGIATKKSLTEWQKKVDIMNNGGSESSDYGQTGPITREKIKSVSCNGILPVNPTIVISSPETGSSLIAGSSVNVEWKSTGIDPRREVLVELVKGEPNMTSGTVFASGTVFDRFGKYSLKTDSKNVADNFYVRISLVNSGSDNKPLAYTGKFSLVTAKPNVTSITVTSPLPGQVFYAGEYLNTKWTTEGIPTGNYVVELRKGEPIGGVEGDIVVTQIAYSKVRSFKLPLDIVPADNYYVKVTYSKGSIVSTAVSEKFTIKLADQSINILSPKPNTEYFYGSSIEVEWSEVKLPYNQKFLVTFGSENYIVSETTTSKRKSTLQISESIGPGDYFIEVAAVNEQGVKTGVTATVKPIKISIDSTKVQTIVMTAPSYYTVVQVGQSLPVSWVTQAIPAGDKVLIELVKGDSGLVFTYDVTINNKKEPIKIPKNTPLGNDYFVRITYFGEDSKKPVSVVSPAITIVKSTNNQEANVSKPARGLIDILVDWLK